MTAQAEDAGRRLAGRRGLDPPFCVDFFSVARREAHPVPTEDAWASVVVAGAHKGTRQLRCAVADGASTSYLGGLWARILVEELVRLPDRASAAPAAGYLRPVDEWARISPLHDLRPSPLPVAAGGRGELQGAGYVEIPAHGATGSPLTADRFTAAVESAQQHWPALMRVYTLHRETSGRPLRFYEDEAFVAGAAATVAVLSVTAPPARRPPLRWFRRRGGGEWNCLALGDSCLFHVRGERLVCSFPLTSSAAFTSRPELVRSSRGARRQPRPTATRGRWQRGDMFLLATDALAQWILREVEAGGREWLVLRQASTEQFARLVESARMRKVMDNDDAALVRARME